MRSILALAVCLALLSGCSAMLEGDRLLVTDHVNQTVLADDPSVLRAENYQGLVNGVLYFVSQGMDTGTIQLAKYTGAPQADLAAVCEEVQQEDPLGCYALEQVDYEYSRVLSYYECTFRFTYRRTPEQLQALRSPSGSPGIRQELARALSAHQSSAALRISGYYAQEDTLHTLLEQAYQSIGPAALGFPQVEMIFYPQMANQSQQYIVELIFSYPLEAAELARQQQEVTAAIQEQAAVIRPTQGEAALAFARQLHYDPAGLSSVHAALLGSGGDSLGVALALQSLCQAYGLDCQLVSGTRNGGTHFWNIVRTEGVYRHLDASSDDPQLLRDSQMAGYRWEAADYPACPG